MFNHHRGLWGYTGAAPDGEPLTIQATGMGGPSAAIVLTELIAWARAARSASAPAARSRPGSRSASWSIARESICADGTSRALGAGERAGGDPALTDAGPRHAHGPARARGTIVSVDLFYDEAAARSGPTTRWPSRWRRPRCSRSGPPQACRRLCCWPSPTRSTPPARARGSTTTRCWRRPRGWARPRLPRSPPERSGLRARFCFGRFGPAAGALVLARPGARRLWLWAPRFGAVPGGRGFAGADRRDRGPAAGAAGSFAEPRRVSVPSWLLDRRQRASIADADAAAVSARSRRSTPSSMPSSRCETERRRRVRRSMSAADGMFSAPIATSCAWAAFSRASNARPIAPVSSGFSSRSDERLAEPVLGAAAQTLAQALGDIARVGHPLLLMV